MRVLAIFQQYFSSENAILRVLTFANDKKIGEITKVYTHEVYQPSILRSQSAGKFYQAKVDMKVVDVKMSSVAQAHVKKILGFLGYRMGHCYLEF